MFRHFHVIVKEFHVCALLIYVTLSKAQMEMSKHVGV